MICALVLANLSVLSWPKKASADAVTPFTIDIIAELNTALTNSSTTSTSIATWKGVFTEVIKNALKIVAKKAMKKMTESTVNWINQGFEGKPLFLDDPESFFTKIGDDTIIETVNEIGDDLDNYPWGKELAQNKVREARTKKKSTTKGRIGVFDLNTRFNLNSPEEIERFYSDTRVGGWDGWTAMVNNPNNNAIGFDLALSNDLQKQTAQKTDNWEKSIQGMFLPTQECANPKGMTREEEDELREADDSAAYEAGRCKSWKDTTPSSLVASKISSALTSGDRQTELSMALGNSLSQVFNALLNNFIDKGLSALTTNITSPSAPGTPSDKWSFGGETFGFEQNDNWANGPDKIIVLDEFLDEVEISIDNINNRLPHIQEAIDTIKDLPNKSATLDSCLPGPNMHWESRLGREVRRNTKKLDKKANKNDETKAENALHALANLETSVDSFVNYINIRMAGELPNSFLMLDWFESLGDKQREAEDLNVKMRNDRENLARLKSIENSLKEISEPLDDTEKNTIKKLWPQFKVMEPKLPKEDDVIEAETTKDTADNWVKEVDDLTVKCMEERDVVENDYWKKYWPGKSEMEIFCADPIADSATRWNDNYVYPNLISVNASNVFNENDIDVNCNIVYYATFSDYYNPDEE